MSAADTPPAKQPPESVAYTFLYEQPDRKHDLIGSWSPALDQSTDGVVQLISTDDPAQAKHWRAQLAASRFPLDTENER